MPPAEFFVAGARIHAIQVGDVVTTIDQWITEGRRDFIVLTGAHGIVEMQSDADLLRINNGAGLTTPDGMPVVWIGRLKGHAHIEKVYAPDIMSAVFEFGVTRGYRHFFYGGQPGVADELAKELAGRFKGIEVVGTYCPPFRPLTGQDAESIAQAINSADPHIVWVGIGCPKQEHWMSRFRSGLNAPVLVGVGAGFDFLSGRKPLAPRWIQRSGFEWLYRTLSEPGRLGPRYARVVPYFLYLVAKDWMRAFGAPRVGTGPR